MNILFVTPAPPFPPHDGARLIVANLARALSKEHTLHLVSLSQTQKSDPELAQHFTRIRLVPHRPPRWLWKWTRSLADDVPLWARAYESDELRVALRAFLRDLPMDVAHIDTGLMAQYADALEVIPRIIAPHDSLTHALAQRIHHAPRRAERIAARLQIHKMRRYEALAYARFARVILVTASERAYLQALNPALRVRVIPNGIDTDFFAPARVLPRPHSIGFLGVMDYAPNQAAVLFFVRQVLPLIWRDIPDAQFTIIGRNPPRPICALQSARIQVTDTVDDVRPFVADSQIMVCPFLERGGIKNKMLEALAMGKAIVATPEAADGLELEPAREFVETRGAREFADACVKLLRDAERCARLGDAARVWALQHTWRDMARQYARVYAEVVNQENRI